MIIKTKHFPYEKTYITIYLYCELISVYIPSSYFVEDLR